MFRTERLDPSHPVDRFNCENGLAHWLKNSALDADRAGNARTYVLLDDSNSVAAYFAILPHAVQRGVLPGTLRKGGPDPAPAYLIAKLARDEHYRGGGVGDVVLTEALHCCLDAIRIGGGRLLVVDAVNQSAHGWYATKGFTPLPNDQERLVMKASRAAASLSVAWP